MVFIWVCVYLVFFFGGTIFGIFLQQEVTKQNIIDVLSYTDLDIDINFNSTKFIQEFNETIVPQLKDVFNQTINNSK